MLFPPPQLQQQLRGVRPETLWLSASSSLLSYSLLVRRTIALFVVVVECLPVEKQTDDCKTVVSHQRLWEPGTRDRQCSDVDAAVGVVSFVVFDVVVVVVVISKAAVLVLRWIEPTKRRVPLPRTTKMMMTTTTTTSRCCCCRRQRRTIVWFDSCCTKPVS